MNINEIKTKATLIDQHQSAQIKGGTDSSSEIIIIEDVDVG